MEWSGKLQRSCKRLYTGVLAFTFNYVFLKSFSLFFFLLQCIPLPLSKWLPLASVGGWLQTARAQAEAPRTPFLKKAQNIHSLKLLMGVFVLVFFFFYVCVCFVLFLFKQQKVQDKAQITAYAGR